MDELLVGDRVGWDFHGYKGTGTLDRIDGLRYYIRPDSRPKSYSLLAIGSPQIEPWPFVVVMEDQLWATV